MDVLLTWVGSRDPTWLNPRTGGDELGPVLALLEQRRFDALHLFYNLGSRGNEYAERANALLRACRKLLPRMEVIHRPIDLVSVIDYREIFRVVNHECQQIIANGPTGARYFVYLSPGTPQMQTVWVLLAQSGLLPARMLEATPRDLVAPGEPIWREVELTLPDFPQVVSPGETARLVGILEARNDNLEAENRRLTAELALCEARGTVDEQTVPEGFVLRDWLVAQERAWHVRALQRAGGNASHAARLLGIDPHAFRKRAADLGIRPRRSA